SDRRARQGRQGHRHRRPHRAQRADPAGRQGRLAQAAPPLGVGARARTRLVESRLTWRVTEEPPSVPYVTGDRVKGSRGNGVTSSTRDQSAAAPAVDGSILALHGAAGNRAIARLLHASAPAVQRNVGWTDASKEGRAWNADEREVGKIRRIPLEGLAEGMQ